MNEFPMFSKQELEAYAARELKRAIEADRTIAKHRAKQAKWQGIHDFEWGNALAALVAVVLVIAVAGTVAYFRYADQLAPDRADVLEFVGDSCFTYAGDRYCAEWVKQLD